MQLLSSESISYIWVLPVQCYDNCCDELHHICLLLQISYILHLTSVTRGNCICNTCNFVTRNWPINMISVNWGREITENIWNLWIRFKPLVNQIYRVLVVCGMIGMSPPSHSITFLWSVSQVSGDHSQYSPPSTIFIFHSNSNYSINSSYRQSIPRWNCLFLQK